MIKKNYAAFRKLRPLKDLYSFDSAKCDPTRGSGSTCRALFAHSTSTPILRKSPGSCAARCAASSQDVLQSFKKIMNIHCIISRRPKFVQIVHHGIAEVCYAFSRGTIGSGLTSRSPLIHSSGSSRRTLRRAPFRQNASEIRRLAYRG